MPLSWLHPGRIIVLSEEGDTERGLSTSRGREPWIIEEIWHSPEGRDEENTLVRIREVATDNQEVQVQQDILENFTHTAEIEIMDTDRLPMLASAAPILFRKLEPEINQFGTSMRAFVGTVERMASALSEMVNLPGFKEAVREAQTKEASPEVQRRTLFERILDEKDEL